MVTVKNAYRIIRATVREQFGFPRETEFIDLSEEAKDAERVATHNYMMSVSDDYKTEIALENALFMVKCLYDRMVREGGQ